LSYLLMENSLRYLIFLFFQVIGSGVSSVFALCLGQTSSFCKAIVFASASVGLQTFNHRYPQPLSSHPTLVGLYEQPASIPPLVLTLSVTL